MTDVVKLIVDRPDTETLMTEIYDFEESLAKVSHSPIYLNTLTMSDGWRGDLMVSALVSGSSGPGSSPGRGHCVVFLGKTLYSQFTLTVPLFLLRKT